MRSGRYRRPSRPLRPRDVSNAIPTAAGGLTEQTLSFSAPALPDLNDGVAYTLAVAFTVSQNVPCLGVECRVAVTPDPAIWVASLWLTGDQSELAFKSTTAFTGQGGALVKTYFDAPVQLTAATNYRASVLTEAYVATTNDTWPQTTGLITAGAANGFLAEDVILYERHFPGTQSGNSANFHVSPIIQVAA